MAPSDIHSSSPTLIFSSFPSAAPSNLATNGPSLAPTQGPTVSAVPTQGATCPFPTTDLKFVFLNLCWVAEFTNGGYLAADFTRANDCSTTIPFTKSAKFSTFDSSSNTFTAGPLGWSGSIVIREDSSVVTTGAANAVVGHTSVWDTASLTFVLNLNVLSC